ncbi:hypothetical protein JHK87_024078 [Glycine soja]|nr:hypothetical protein JHK87_024078 [Glycine soja]
MSGHVAPPIYEYNNEVISDEFFLDESDILHELSMDDEDLPDVDDDSETEHVEEVDDAIDTFKSHNGELYAVACSPTDATLVATGGGDDRGFLWKIGEKGDWVSELQGHKDSVSSLAFSYDGQFLASGCFHGIVQVWDAYGNLKNVFEGLGGGIELVPRISMFGSGTLLIELPPPTCFAGHHGSVTCGDFTPDGETICTGSADKTLRIWNSSGTSHKVVRGHGYHTKGLTCLAISSNSTLALTGSEDGSAYIVKIDGGKVIDFVASHPDSIECVGFSPSDSLAAIGGMDQRLVVWDIQHFLSRATCDHEGGVTCMTWVGSSCVATGCVDGIVRLWDIRSGECVEKFRGHSDAIQSLSVSANGDYIVSVSLDHTARVFEVRMFQ